MSKVIRASALVLLLTCTAQAGWIQNDKPAPPPPPSANATQEAATATQEPATSSDIEEKAEISFTDITLSLLNHLLALL